jgi:hypothetical protein
MMSAQEVSDHLAFLELGQSDAARLLGVVPRTVSRWLAGEEVPGPVEQALRAWHVMQRHGLMWRPDMVSITKDDQTQIGLTRENAIAVAQVIERVKARCGPRFPWLVDRQNCRAVSGPMEIGFYRLTNGSFSLSTYRRSDMQPDVQRDLELIEDAIYCIAMEMRKEAVMPVTLVFMDGPGFVGPNGHFGKIHTEEFPSNERALERAFILMDKSAGHSFAIRTGTANSTGEFLWQEPEIRAEYDRRMKAGQRVKRRAF